MIKDLRVLFVAMTIWMKPHTTLLAQHRLIFAPVAGLSLVMMIL